MDARILLVEDEVDLRDAMATALTIDGHDVATAADGDAALEALAQASRNLVVLDIGLGAGPDGVEVCRRLRQIDADVYVMMLTAYDSEADVIGALEAGADDYLIKPVGIAELRSRVRAALRRLGRAVPRGADETRLRHASLTVEPASRRVAVGDKTVVPTRTEYAILEALLRADGAVRSRTQLLQAVYGDDAYRDPRGVDVHVHHLREKLESAGGDAAWVATVRGVGYRLGP
jgi:DNA-binding response OmpR family regulator